VTRARLAVAATTAALALASSACCRLVDDGPPENRRKRVDLAPQATDVDLGVASFPRAKPGGATTKFRFVVPPLVPDTYRAAFALEAGEASDVRKHFFAYANTVKYQASGSDRFKWAPPRGCSDDLHCVYDSAATRDGPDLRPLAELFRAQAKKAHLSSLETAELVVAFVQSIHYQVPTEPFGLLPPALVASESRGDCDSKSLLALVILHHLGVDAILVESEAHHHAMLGVALPTPGTSIEFNGRRYSLAECTAVGWPIGQIAPQLLHPNDWHPMNVRFDAKPPVAGDGTHTHRHRRH
jgi:hypothetical protein